MKKSTLLSLFTFGTIVVTSVGTYATWDKTQETTEASVTFRSPVTVNVGTALSLTENNSTLGTTPTATGTVKFNVEDRGLVDTMTITPTITGDGVTTSDFDVVIKDTEDSSTALSGTVTDGFTDKTLTTTKYEVTITPKESSASKITGQSVNVTLKAELSKAAGV